MIRAKKTSPLRVAVALAWDGSRCPLRAVPRAARGFLGAKAKKCPGPAVLADGLNRGLIRELRVCWLPRLQGGEPVLAANFVTGDGRRLNFHAGARRRFGDALVVVYRRC
jgi:hypothetical protein